MVPGSGITPDPGLNSGSAYEWSILNHLVSPEKLEEATRSRLERCDKEGDGLDRVGICARYVDLSTSRQPSLPAVASSS